MTTKFGGFFFSPLSFNGADVWLLVVAVKMKWNETQ